MQRIMLDHKYKLRMADMHMQPIIGSLILEVCCR